MSTFKGMTFNSIEYHFIEIYYIKLDIGMNDSIVIQVHVAKQIFSSTSSHKFKKEKIDINSFFFIFHHFYTVQAGQL